MQSQSMASVLGDGEATVLENFAPSIPPGPRRTLSLRSKSMGADCDSSHPPKSIPSLSDAGADRPRGGGILLVDYTRYPTIDPGWPSFRKRLASFVSTNTYEFTISFVITLNIGMLCYQTDLDANPESDKPSWLHPLTITILWFYACELGVRIYAFRWGFFSSRSNLVDAGTLTIDILVELTESLMRGPSPSGLRVIRVLRAVRFVRAVRTLVMFRELYMMLHGFVSAMRALLWAMVILGVMLTMWSVLAVELLHPLNQEIAATGAYDGCERCPRAFESVMAANITFIQHIIAGDSWGRINIPILEKYPLSGVLIFMVMVTIDLGLLNLILTTIVERAQAAHEEDTKFLLQQRMEGFETAKRNLRKLCRAMDTDDSGSLSLDELMEGFDKLPPFRDTMRLMDVGRDDLAALFTVLDEDMSGTVDYQEFIEQLHKLKSQNKEMLLVFLRSTMKEVKVQVRDTRFQVEHLTAMLVGDNHKAGPGADHHPKILQHSSAGAKSLAKDGMVVEGRDLPEAKMLSSLEPKASFQDVHHFQNIHQLALHLNHTPELSPEVKKQLGGGTQSRDSWMWRDPSVGIPTEETAIYAPSPTTSRSPTGGNRRDASPKCIRGPLHCVQKSGLGARLDKAAGNASKRSLASQESGGHLLQHIGGRAPSPPPDVAHTHVTNSRELGLSIWSLSQPTVEELSFESSDPGA